MGRVVGPDVMVREMRVPALHAVPVVCEALRKEVWRLGRVVRNETPAVRTKALDFVLRFSDEVRRHHQHRERVWVEILLLSAVACAQLVPLCSGARGQN